MTETLCVVCREQPAGTAYGCRGCADGLAGEMRHLAALADDGTTTVARLDRHGERGKGNGDRPEPVNLRAGETLARIQNTVTTVARDIAEERGVRVEYIRPRGPLCRTGMRCGGTSGQHGSCASIRRDPPGPLALAAAFISTQTDWLRHRREAEVTFPELQRAVDEMRWLVDGPAPKWWAGVCGEPIRREADAAGIARVIHDPDGTEECAEDLWAKPGAKRVGCRSCKHVHDADERRRWLLEEAEDAVAHAGLIAAAVTALGLKVSAAQVRGYAFRGRLPVQLVPLADGVHGPREIQRDRHGRRVYRVGDVIDLVRAEAARKAAMVESGAA